jgi:hypothetical protein
MSGGLVVFDSWELSRSRDVDRCSVSQPSDTLASPPGVEDLRLVGFSLEFRALLSLNSPDQHSESA